MPKKGYRYGTEPRRVKTPPKPEPPKLFGINAWYLALGVLALILTPVVIVQCNAYIYEPPSTVTATVEQSVKVPTGFAVITVPEYMGPAAGYPGYALAIPAPMLTTTTA